MSSHDDTNPDTDTTDDTETRVRTTLTRRTILAGIASVGAVGTIAGAGTRMAYSDREPFGNNLLESGSLDLGVAWEEYYNGEQVESVGTCGSDAPEDYVDSQDPVVTLDGVEPGDEGRLQVCLWHSGNESVVWMRLRAIEFAENGVTQLEADDGDTTDAVGELQEYLDLTVWRDAECDGTQGDEEQTLATGSMAAVVDGPLGKGVRLADDDSATTCIGLSWTLPEDDVTPSILTDAVDFTLEFAAEQARHNDNPTNPWTEP